MTGLYYQYETVASVYKGFQLSADIKQMSVRERRYWDAMARYRLKEVTGG